MKRIETMTDFYKIKEMWMEQTVTEDAKDRIREVSVCSVEAVRGLIGRD